MTISHEPDPPDKFEYNGETIDDTPQIGVLLPTTGIAYLLHGLEKLRFDEAWAGDQATIDVATEYIEQLAHRLLEDIMPDDLWGPWEFLPATMYGTAAATLVYYNTVNSHRRWGVYNNPPVQFQPFCSCPVYLNAGTYVLEMSGETNVSYGIVQIELVGPEFIAVGQFDGYSAAPAGPNIVRHNFTVNISGKFNLELRCDGKNPLSTSYYVVTEGVNIRRVT